MNRRLQVWTSAVMFVVFSTTSTIGQAPDWWATRNVFVPGAAPDDYAVLNQGQLKHLAYAAYLEMQMKFTGGPGLKSLPWSHRG